MVVLDSWLNWMILKLSSGFDDSGISTVNDWLG